MDIQKQIAMQAVLKAHKRNGTKPPPELTGSGVPPKKKIPVKTGADPKQSSKNKNAAAAALAAKFGGGPLRGPPPSSTKSVVTVADASIDKYRKMIKMKVPVPAIRAKMAAEGIPSSVIDDVVSGGGPSGSGRPSVGPSSAHSSQGGASRLSPADEAIAEQYRKMVKIGLPEGAIVHKMNGDGVSKYIQNSVLAGEQSGKNNAQAPPPPSRKAASSGPTSSLSQDDENIATGYRKMMKLGLPAGAIIHKMTGDGIPKHIQESVLANEVPSVANTAGPSEAGGPISKLSPDEEQVAAPYRRMVKMSLPDGAILHKMAMDNVAKNIQDSVMAREVPGTTPTASSSIGGGGLGIGASAFAAGAAGLKKATPKKSKSMPSKAASGGSPLAMAAAAAAALRGKGPKKMRNVKQTVPQKSMSMSGPEAMAQAAAAVAARRKSSNAFDQFEKKSTPTKSNEQPRQMVTLKARSPANSSAPAQNRISSPPRPPTQRQHVAKAATPVPARTPVSTPSPLPPKTKPPQPSTTVKPRIEPTSSRLPARSPAPTNHVSQRRASGQPASNEISTLSPTSIPSQETSPDKAINQLDTDEKEVAEYYCDLVKEGLSLDSLKEEMTNDGAPPHIQKAVLLNFSAQSQSQQNGISTANAKEIPPTNSETHSTQGVESNESYDEIEEKEIDSEITELEEEVAEHYRGMVHDGTSLEQVIEEMIADGAPEKIQKAVTSTFGHSPCSASSDVPAVAKETPVLSEVVQEDVNIVNDPQTPEPIMPIDAPIDVPTDDHSVGEDADPSSFKESLQATVDEATPSQPVTNVTLDTVGLSDEEVDHKTDVYVVTKPQNVTSNSTASQPPILSTKTTPSPPPPPPASKSSSLDKILLKEGPTLPVKTEQKERAKAPKTMAGTTVTSAAAATTTTTTTTPVPTKTSTSTSTTNNKKKRQRKKKKETTILSDGAEQHCACTIM